MKPIEKAFFDATIKDIMRDFGRAEDPNTIKNFEKVLDRAIFDRVHPDIERFLFDKDYLGISRSEVRPNVLKAMNLITNTEDATVVKMLLGKGSGKSYIVSHLLAYKTHEFLSHINPQDFYGLATGSPVAILNLSVNAPQALNVIFKTFANLIERIPSFENMDKKYRLRRGDIVEPYKDFTNGTVPEKYRAARAEIEFPEKNLLCISGHSKAASFYGYSVFAGTIDEADHIERETRAKRKTRIEQETTYTEELYAGLNSAIFSRFGIYGLLFLISTSLAKSAFLSRRVFGDRTIGEEISIDDGHVFIEHEVRAPDKPECYITKSIESPGNELTIIAPTWVMKDEPREMYIRSENDVKSKRDYGCEPPDAASGALPKPDIVAEQANRERVNPWDEEKHTINMMALNIDKNASYYFHWDLSLTGDNVGLCLLHRDHESGRYIIDMYGNVITSQQTPFDMNLPIRMAVTLQKNGVHLAMVTFDGWQSVKLVQDLVALGIPAAQLSADKNKGPYDTLITMLIQDMLDYPHHPQFEKEMRYLEDMGDKYDHPQKFPDNTMGSKDIADAVACAIYNCINALSGLLISQEEMMKAMDGIVNVNSSVIVDGKEVPICEIDDHWNLVWNAKNKVPPMYSRAAYIDTINDNVLLLIGYRRGNTLIVDFVEEYSVLDNDMTRTALVNIVGFKSEFVAAAPTAPHTLIDMIRSVGVRVMTPEMAFSEMKREKHMRPIRAIHYPQIEIMVQAIKGGELRFCEDPRLVRELYEITEKNYESMPFACALAGWYHYIQQNQRKGQPGQMPKSILNTAPYMGKRTSLFGPNTGPIKMPRSVIRKKF